MPRKRYNHERSYAAIVRRKRVNVALPDGYHRVFVVLTASEAAEKLKADMRIKGKLLE